MNPVINLTPWSATADQREAGVRDVPIARLPLLQQLLVPAENYRLLNDRQKKAAVAVRATRIIDEFVRPAAMDSLSQLLQGQDWHGPNLAPEMVDLTTIDPACGRVRCMLPVSGFQPLIAELVRQLRDQGHEPLFARPVDLDTRYVREVCGGLLPA